MSDQTNKNVDNLISSCLKGACVEGFIQNVIEIVLLSIIYFYVIGYYTNSENLKYFVAAYFLVAVLIIPVEAIHSARNTLIKKLSNMQDSTPSDNGNPTAALPDAEKMEQAKFKGSWELTFPGGFIVGIMGAVVAYFTVDMFEAAAHIFWIALVVVFVVVLVYTTLSIHINFRRHAIDIYRILHDQKFKQPQNADNYIFGQHILPWCFILGILSLLISHKTYSETLYLHPSISISSAAFAAGSTCYVMMIWMWYVSQQQIRAEASLGLVHIEGDTSLSLSDSLFLIHIVAAVVVGLGFVVGLIFDLSEYSMMQAMMFHLIMVVCSGIVGNVLGIISGYDSAKPGIQES